MKTDEYKSNTRPFVKGDRVGLYIPLLKKLMKKYARMDILKIIFQIKY